MVKDEDVCLHCGLCAERCPTNAWDMQKSIGPHSAARIVRGADRRWLGRPRTGGPHVTTYNDFVIRFANVNGSGSASANGMFAKALFRMGVPVATRNIFPSNIEGLPTWFEVRVSGARAISVAARASTSWWP